MLTLLPWHQFPWSNVINSRRAGRLAHGLLLKEPAGTGAFEFAQFLGCSLLCLNPLDNYAPCGTCKSCALYEAGNHTDCQVIQPEEQGRQIKVEQIRTLIDFFTLKSQFEGYKVAIIKPADAMNRSAANTLLKTLEEPPPLSVLILITQRPERMPVTLRSRCQQITFQPDFSELSLSWLAARINDQELAAELLVTAKGAPLAALQMYESGTLDKLDKVLDAMTRSSKLSEDPLKTARHWDELGAEQVMLWLLQVLAEMIRLKAGNLTSNVNPSASYKRLQILTNGLDLYKLMTSYDLLMQNYRLCTGQVSYDTQGLLEEFVIHWQQTTSTA
jgi:DNA polymerase-3 subunit delta'